MDRSASAINVLIIVCVILFAVKSVPNLDDDMIRLLGLYYPGNGNFRVWQFISNIFMHGGFTHIFFNMYALWAFGSPLEKIWGRNKFLIFFFLSGIGAGVIYILVNYFRFNSLYDQLIAGGVSAEQVSTFLRADRDILQTALNNMAALAPLSDEKLFDFWALFNIPVVGASGAIYGVLVAFGILFPNAKLFLIFLPVPIAAKYFIPALIALDLFSGVTGFSIFGGGVAHFGHVGGAIIGFLLMWYWRTRKPTREFPDIGSHNPG